MSDSKTDEKPTEPSLTEFKKIIVDFTKDILTTFPEYESKLNEHLKNLLDGIDDAEQTSLYFVYNHCKQVYPERFFEILYQNQELFVDKVKYSTTEFLPGIHFSELWDEYITDKTRDTIWKYIQLVLFTVVSTISDGASFGDTAKLFEAIDEDEFKSKLGETIEQMHNLFGNSACGREGAARGNSAGGSAPSPPTTSTEGNSAGDSSAEGSGGFAHNVGDLPNPQDIHDHVAGMLDGKLGKLAKEIAAETAADLNMDMENAGSVNDVFKQLFKNPTKLMGLVKSVGSKLDEKLKSGDISETELLKEASEMVQKMKDMPGMDNLQSMMSKMGMGMPSGSKMNMGAMQSHLNRNMKASQQKDRMRSKLEAKRQAQAQAQQQSKLYKVSNENGVENLVFSTGENVERSSKPAQAQAQAQAQAHVEAIEPAKKKKNKNKKK